MKIKIDQDELFPYYVISRRGKEYEIDEKIIKDYIEAKKTYNKAWRKLHNEIKKTW